MNNKVLIAVIAAIVIAGAVFAFTQANKDEEPVTTDTPDTTQNTESESTDTTNNVTDNGETGTDQTNPEAVTITYGDNGFSPSSYTAAVGASVVIKNGSTRTLDFASDDHPVHTDNPELNAGTIEPGAQKTITVNEIGVWGFHNHEFDSHTGTITVE